MINYGLVKGFNRPKTIEITESQVFIASNIQPCVLDVNNVDIPGFQYNYCAYTKDEYLEYLHNALVDTQFALLEVMKDDDEN